MSTVSRSINTPFPSRRPRRAILAAFFIALTAVALFTATPSHAAQYASPAAGETKLYPGDSIVNGSTELRFESDQNLVLYNGSTAVWSSGTSSTTSCSDCFAYFRNEGVLQLLNPNTFPQVYWESTWSVWGNSGATLVVDSALPFPRIYQAGALMWGGMATPTEVSVAGCNAMAWSQVPDHPEYLIGRNLVPCNSGHWYLSIGHMNWSTRQLTEVRRLLDVPQTIRGNYRIIDAYDPHLYKRSDGSTWLAFECHYDQPITGVGSCMGRLLTPSGDPNTWSIDPNSMSLVVQEGLGGGYRYSASVPKVVQFGGEDYLYYSAVRLESSSGVWRPPFHTYGIKLHQVDGAFFEYSSTAPIQSVLGGGTTTQVWAANPQDPYLGSELADGFAVWAEGPYLYMTGGLGGSGCIRQTVAGEFNGFTNVGCYRMAIARTTNPLEWQAFNYSLVSDLELPTNAVQYARPVKDPLTNRNYFLVELLRPIPGAPTWNRHPVSPHSEGVLALMPRDGIMDAAFLPTWLGNYASGYFNMSAGETRYMASGFLAYQMDGNLVLYNNYWNPLWASHSSSPDYCQGHDCKLRFQSDGNLVAYRDGWTNPYFATHTANISPPGSSLAWLHFSNKPNDCHAQIWQDWTNWFCQNHL